MIDISVIEITSDMISLSQNYIYAGKTIYPVVTVKHNDKALSKGSDYTIKYYNNVNVGSASLMITGNTL